MVSAVLEDRRRLYDRPLWASDQHSRQEGTQ